MAEEEKRKVVHAEPTKDFFIRMITRDITLQDRIFDLLDNCLDGAGREIKLKQVNPQEEQRYLGYSAKIVLEPDRFEISDNCGGITLADAVDYAFHFGRRTDAPSDANHSIGLYGIGMKRAVFKIGKKINVESHADESFLVHIDVDEWAKDPKNWDFELEELPRREDHGTTIRITTLNEGIADEFRQAVFKNSLIKNIARDYSFFLQKGFAVAIGDQRVQPFQFGLRESQLFKPIKIQYQDETGVDVEILAGLAGSPPDDTSPEVKLADVEYWGWFVLCNDRVVIAGDKTDRTVWGEGAFQRWHPQYNGFMGIVSFRSTHPAKLPWVTTKRDIDQTSPLYRRAVAKMKDATRAYLDYTNERKEDLEKAKNLEQAASLKPLRQIALSEKMGLPSFTAGPKIKRVTISYQQPIEKVVKSKHAFGNSAMSNKAIGEATFAYYFKNEVEE